MYDDETDDLEDGLNADLRHLATHRALKKTQEIMARVEARLGAAAPLPQPEGKHMKNTQPNIFSTGENVLAKAADSLIDAPRIMAAATASAAVDVQTMGVISSYVSTRQFDRAREVYLEAVQKHTLAKAPDAAAEAINAVGAPNPQADLSAVVGAVGRMERTLANVTMRLSRLEARTPPAPTPTMGRTVAKGAQGKRPRTAEELHLLIDRYVDDPTRAGAISGMVAAGQLAEAEQMLLAAKRAHDTEKARQERKSWA